MTLWAIVLQWSRLGLSAAVFLVAARLLPLAEIGAFTTAFALPRLLQCLHKAGICELRITSAAPDRPLFELSLFAGLAAVLLCLAAVPLLPQESRPHLLALAALPVLNGLAAVSEGRLRRALRLRALALRTLAAQGLAAALALYGLTHGWGGWSLTGFALANAALNAALSLALAPPRPRPRGALHPLIPGAIRLTLRPLLGTATFPAVQLLIGLALGLPAAGAFQIAVRLVDLLDALALAPLRYLALPRFKALAGSTGFAAKLRQSLWQVAGLTALIYPLAWALAPHLLPLIGAQKAEAALALLPPLLFTGAMSALLMPLTQALIATGQSALPLRLAALTLALSLALLAPVLAHPLALWALPLASTIAGLHFLREARVASHVFEGDLTQMPGQKP
ncbi:oligosaccharide flippase family protein [Marinovum sp.]|uniref:oligosaccharide flippase family protein n=1 Tax=Marinovum sp. TaxID=2024839 RepID=UPI002B270F9A|nr:oligosaccharide flippase family protein [Marinovum sp.]